MRLKNVKGSKEAVSVHPLVLTDKDIAVYKNNKPLYIEIGCGKGQFILQNSINNLDKYYIGIEMYSSVLFRAIEKVEEYLDLPKRHVSERSTLLKISQYDKVSNLRFMNIDATNINEYFDKGDVDRIYLNFSDPWPKARHAKRRLTSDRFLNRYKTILSKGGLIEFKTDNLDLFNFSLEEFRNNKDYELIDFTFDLYNSDMLEDNIPTEYEEKFRSKGNKINKLVAKLLV